MKILITGANGLLGTAATEQLSKHHEIYALVREIPSQVLPSVTYLQHNLSHSPTILYDKIKKLDAIVHTAQSRLYRDFPNSAQDIFDINVKTTLNLLEMGKHYSISNFLFTSTGTVYEPFNSTLTEDEPVNPQSFYGVTKYLSEKLLSCYQSMFKVSIFRLFFLYGNFPTSSLISTLIQKVNKGEPISLEGQEGLTFTPTHVADVARLIECSLKHNWEGIINVASPQSITLKNLVLLLCKKINKTPNWTLLDKQPPIIVPSLVKLKFQYPEMDFIELNEGLDHLIKASI